MDHARRQLRELEAGSIHVLREVAAELARPALLLGASSDTGVLARLAEKAFHPVPVPFALLHLRAGRDAAVTLAEHELLACRLGRPLVVASTLRAALAEHRFDAILTGGRRDEHRVRAPRRVYEPRDAHGDSTPQGQRPETWSLYNGRLRLGEHVHVSPLSDWTELDVWRYALAERIAEPLADPAAERELQPTAEGAP